VCDEHIADYHAGRLALVPGCSLEKSLEEVIKGTLNNIREEARLTAAPMISAFDAPVRSVGRISALTLLRKCVRGSSAAPFRRAFSLYGTVRYPPCSAAVVDAQCQLPQVGKCASSEYSDL
jgi:hypothetical protein